MLFKHPSSELDFPEFNMVDHDATAKMTTTPTEAIVYDKDGDLTLCVGFTETFYQVCPQSLRRSSPVFGKMLFGKFAESRPTVGQWVVDLPDDDNEAMEIFLGMVHSRFEMVPNTLSIAKLYALLTLTNKYDATALVRPWARSWIDAMKKGETWDYRLLGIAWEMGDDYLFREMVWLMVWNSVVGSDGWLRFGSKQQLLSVDMPIEPGNDVGVDPYSLEHFIYLRPTGTIETIEAARKSMVEAALKPLARPESRSMFIMFLGWVTQPRRDHDVRFHCTCAARGSLCDILADKGLSPKAISRGDTFQGSLWDLRDIPKSREIWGPQAACEEFIADRLREGQQESSRAWANFIHLVIREDQITAMKKQAQKTGIWPTYDK